MAMCVIIGKPKPSIVWTDSAQMNPMGAPSVFAGVSIGTAAADRLIFVATYRSTATGVTVGGVSATLVASSSDLRLWSAPVPTGTTATISVTETGFGEEMIEVWAAYNYNSSTPFATATYSAGANAFTHSCNVNTPANGFVVGVASSSTVGATSATWAGITLDNTNFMAAKDSCQSAASVETISASTPLSITTTWAVSALAEMITVSYS